MQCSAFGAYEYAVIGAPDERGLLSMLVVENHVCRSVGLDVSLRQALRSAAPYLQQCAHVCTHVCTHAMYNACLGV